MKNSELPLYQPPRARDLSAFSASGMVPLGQCMSGPLPYEECVNGTNPAGTNPDCDPGSFADWPKCTTGSVAAVICSAGGDAGGT